MKGANVILPISIPASWGQKANRRVVLWKLSDITDWWWGGGGGLAAPSSAHHLNWLQLGLTRIALALFFKTFAKETNLAISGFMEEEQNLIAGYHFYSAEIKFSCDFLLEKHKSYRP